MKDAERRLRWWMWTILVVLTFLVFLAGMAAGTEIPECPLSVSGGAASVYMVAIYAHESTSPGVRYTFTTDPVIINPGYVATPCPCEGYPIGFEWWWVIPDFSKSIALLKECGDTSRIYPFIFDDGFESGDTSRWSRVVE